MKYKAHLKKYLADTLTPVNVYLKLRDQFPQCHLLESSDFNSAQNSRTFIVFNPLEYISIDDTNLKINKEGDYTTYNTKDKNPLEEFKAFISSIDVEQSEDVASFNGLYGYTSFEAVKYFDEFDFEKKDIIDEIPLMHYAFYKYIIVFNHFNNELSILENCRIDELPKIEHIEGYIFSLLNPQYTFTCTAEEDSQITDAEFKSLVTKGKQSCQIGDVFQIVYSRRFKQAFVGDEFNVYRALRSINPSPYLFYFDYGNFKLFGSSPEAQMIIKDKKAIIHPIAGTYKKTGDTKKDEQLALELSQDPKENAEHTMLVDLARNDLSRKCNKVKVEKYKEIQHFSHVIHIVSEVTGELKPNANSIDIFASTFPAGTLSGAPKYKALQLINKEESHERRFYGGAIGYFGLNGDVNHAITIRSFLSHDGELNYQAGGGIVVDSSEEGELNEVDNKLRALRVALKKAENIV